MISLRWRDWLLVEDTAPADVNPAPGALVRRITPKSVFVAPNFNPGCKEGQQIDSQGKCVQIVRVDQAAHLDFLLKRFNSMFAAPPPPSKKVEKDSTGPFHVSLPLGGAQETFKPHQELQDVPKESEKPHTSTTIQPLTTTSPPQLTTTTESPSPTTTTTQKTETTTLTMPPATSFTTDATSELLNFSDESTTSRVTHETLKPSTFASPTLLSSPTTTQVDEIWSSHRIQTATDVGSHRPQSSIDTFASHRPQQVFGSHWPQTLPTTQTDTTFESKRPQDLFGSQVPQTHTDVFGSHRPQTLPTTQTDAFASHSPQTLPTTQSDIFGSHRPLTLPTTQTEVFGSHRPQTLPTTQTDVFESHRTHTLPTTFNTQNPDFLFEGVHRTRPSSLQTSTATAQTSEDSSDRTTSFPTHTTLFTSPTLQTIQPFEGIHRTRPSSLHTTFPVPSTVKTNEVFTLKGTQRTTPSSSQLSFTTTTSATTTFVESTDGEDKHPEESLVFSGDSDNKKPFVIIVANNTFKRQEPASVTDETDYDSTTESTTVGSSGVPESTPTVYSHGGDFYDLESPSTEASGGTRFGYFSSVLTPPPTVDEYSLEQFPAVEEVPSSFDKDSLDVAASFQQMNDNTHTKCDPSYQVSQVRDGRIISQSSVTNCQPENVKTTTPQPPMRTVAPTQTTNFRFPLESQTANRPSYIRFPEVQTASNYNTKLWGSENNNNNYGADSSKHQNSYFWPQQWNPFPSSMVRGWPIMDRSHISSNVYRKQYYQHPVPQWMNKNSNQYSWQVGRV
ncbi:hypothetical protein LSTR_LSTR017067 [Laodelphax striatellus]|uniref:Uncharacterized protein n=1 Tax=Laodelphax striatellus TaxID=195883 RepID=A0A482X5A8_LAOST|nr:hypothetical protein LSTR_LSTR017067 [Laodelphax striatellus]